MVLGMPDHKPVRSARNSSIRKASPPSRQSRYTVPGTRPSTSMASVSAPNATNSPWGMKITRVTANTSTSAMPSRA